MENQRVRMFFVAENKIKQALVDMQQSYGFGFSWIKSCDYLKDDKKFAVQVVMTHSYPFLESEWANKWESDKVAEEKKHQIFTTSKGFVFTKTPLGWIDETARLEWMNEFKTSLNHHDAEKWAEGQKRRLATQADFIEAEKHGIRELPGMTWKGYWFWSSTQYPGYSYVAYVFVGADGYADDYGYRDDSYSVVAARCVSPAGQGAGVKR